MIWKNWPYWVRGGIFGIIIGLLISLYFLSRAGYCAGDFGFVCPEGFFDVTRTNLMAGNGRNLVDSVVVVTAFAFISSGFGWLYGKIFARGGFVLWRKKPQT